MHEVRGVGENPAAALNRVGVSMRLTDSEKRAIRTYARTPLPGPGEQPWTDAQHDAFYAVQNAAAGALGQEWDSDDLDLEVIDDRFFHNLDVARRWKRRYGGGA